MSSTISVSNYEFHGQVYSPAFSDPPSPMSTTSASSFEEEEEENRREMTVVASSQMFVNRKPKYPTKYHELLLPLSPVTTLHVETRTTSSIIPTHTSCINMQLQQQFLNVLRLSEPREVEMFLQQHSENIDVNQYSCDGQTPLHDACVEGNLELVKILVQFGADLRLTNRDGFSVIHLATFSGNSALLLFLMGRR